MSKLNQVMHDINKKYGTEIVQKGTGRLYVEKIPFSSPRINYITYGGIPIGKGTELIGPEGGGKTTTAIDLVANAQIYAKQEMEKTIKEYTAEAKRLEKGTTKRDKNEAQALLEEVKEIKARGPRKVVYVDAENTLDEEWAELNGVDVTDILLIRPENQTAEQVLQMMMDILATGDVLLMVLDSIPMLVSQNLYEEDIEKRSYGGIADAMTRFTAKVSPVISKYRTALVMINQIRDNLDNPFDQWHTPGGRALKHFYSLRIGFRKGSLLNEKNEEVPNRTEEPAGNRVAMTIVKQKTAKPDRKLGFYTLNYTTGIDVIEDTLETAIKYNYIAQAGAWFNFIDPETGELMLDESDKPIKFQGKTKVSQFLRENNFIFQELWEAVNKKITE